MFTESRQPAFKMLTPREAEALLAINNFPGQRPLRPLKSRDYADNMANGTHRRIEISVVKVKETGVEYLMNGQHNCHAVIAHGKPFPAVFSYYTCDTMEEAWRLFTTFDVHQARTDRMFMGARRGLFRDERLHDVPLRSLEACATALYLLGDGTEPKFGVPHPANKQIKADLVDKHADDVLFVAQFVEYRHLTTVGVVAAMISTRRTNKVAAQEFWARVADGDMLAVSDPRHRLREALKELSGAMKGGGYSKQRAAFIQCIAWWNSWRTNDRRRSVKVASTLTLPKVAA